MTSTTAPLAPDAARRVFYALTVTRWFPIGLVVGVTTLWPLEQGLSVAQALSASSVVGVVVFALELPTSGFADAFGRRGVYVAAAVACVASGVLFWTATSWWQFAVAAVLTGVFRALDSGPLEAWFVDTVHASEPGADVDRPLAGAGVLLGAAMATGALVSGALVWWHPWESRSALLLPGLCYVALGVVHAVAILALLREPPRPAARTGWRRARDSVRDTPRVVRDGLSQVRRSRVLAGLLGVEVCWAAAMVVFETFQPIRLAELVGGEERAGAIMGPVAAAGWAVFGLGAALAAIASRRLGVTRTAILARVLNGLGAVVMGLVLGPVALVTAYAVTYTLHGAAGPMHAALLHREATAGNRATVLSMNSMVGFLAFSVVASMAGLMATHVSTQAAMVTFGAVSVIGAWCYRPALRAERHRAAPATHQPSTV